jgi:hypothetical protein
MPLTNMITVELTNTVNARVFFLRFSIMNHLPVGFLQADEYCHVSIPFRTLSPAYAFQEKIARDFSGWESRQPSSTDYIYRITHLLTASITLLYFI